ncbi:hypothetical protein QBC46DRAFT_414346 [Diplogelasinospora grovesii]|uniref:Uncharacterized protein n=1 Tax=Diplogelasinospora grovesii TaxID=303347 RepID=A0AAN6MWR9_9PEZI|nr:hypothetical protein QBC46DRAFT_414346 [Diplogelasinospora grovesii]
MTDEGAYDLLRQPIRARMTSANSAPRGLSLSHRTQARDHQIFDTPTMRDGAVFGATSERDLGLTQPAKEAYLMSETRRPLGMILGNSLKWEKVVRETVTDETRLIELTADWKTEVGRAFSRTIKDDPIIFSPRLPPTHRLNIASISHHLDQLSTGAFCTFPERSKPAAPLSLATSPTTAVQSSIVIVRSARYARRPQKPIKNR